MGVFRCGSDKIPCICTDNIFYPQVDYGIETVQKLALVASAFYRLEFEEKMSFVVLESFDRAIMLLIGVIR